MSNATMRDVLTWTGTASGLSMTAWLIPAGLTSAAGAATQARLDGWILVLAALLLYGVAIRNLAPRDAPSEQQRQDDRDVPTPSRRYPTSS